MFSFHMSTTLFTADNSSLPSAVAEPGLVRCVPARRHSYACCKCAGVGTGQHCCRERVGAREDKERAERVLNGSTDEPSCGGTDMDVYLRGNEVRKIDWWVEEQ